MNTKDTVKLRVVIQETSEAVTTSGQLADAITGTWFMFSDKSGLLCKLKDNRVVIFCVTADGKLHFPFHASVSSIMGAFVPVEVTAILPGSNDVDSPKGS